MTIQIEIAHIRYHLGQINFIDKQIKDKDWKILSILKNVKLLFRTSVNFRIWFSEKVIERH